MPYSRGVHHTMSTTRETPDQDRTQQAEAGLDYQRCRWCGTPAYRRLLCPTCAASDMEPARSGGVGIVTRPPAGALTEAAVQLTEGFTVQGRVLGVPGGRVAPGSLVRLTAPAEADPDRGELRFRLCEE